MALAKLAGQESIPKSTSNTCVSVHGHGGMHAESRGSLGLLAKPQLGAVGLRTADETG